MLRTSYFDTNNIQIRIDKTKELYGVKLAAVLIFIIIIELRAAAINKKRLFHLYSSITTRTWPTKFFGSSRQFPALIQTKSRFPKYSRAWPILLYFTIPAFVSRRTQPKQTKSFQHDMARDLSLTLSLSCDCGDLIARKFCMYYVQCIFQ